MTEFHAGRTRTHSMRNPVNRGALRWPLPARFAVWFLAFSLPVFGEIDFVRGQAVVAPAATEDLLTIERSTVTGSASFVTARDGGQIAVAVPAGKQVEPVDFFRAYGTLFGITDADSELILDATRSHRDALGYQHTTFQQVHRGVRVFAGVVKAHQDSQGGFVSANGDFFPIPPALNIVPSLTLREAEAIAIGQLETMTPTFDASELVIVDPAWYGDPPAGVHLAYHLIVADRSAAIREEFFVDAHSGKILDRWNTLHTVKDREIHNGGGGASLPGPVARVEGQLPTGNFDVDAAYDYYGDTYDYYFRSFGRDSIDGLGMTMVATVHSTAPPCPNAFWDDQLLQMVFCTGLVTDDIVGHELTHGVTQFTAGLIYQNQSGQLNESYSDVFGEMIDLFNGDAAFAGAPTGPPFWPTHPTGPGQDTPNNLRGGACSGEGFRWMMGEDATGIGGAIRDMWNPPCFSDPDRNNSPLQTCPGNDSGGVHSGSGIANHAFAMLTDGKTFNGFTVSAIGPIKAGAVWYRALTSYLTPASDYLDAYSALSQSAADLIGTTPNDPRTGAPSASAFTAADALEVDEALKAVEMNTDGRCGSNYFVFDATPPTLCSTRTVVFADDFESGVNGWSVSNSGPPTPYNWEQTTDFPGSTASSNTVWYAQDANIGNCTTVDESGLHSLFSPNIVMPAALSRPTMVFRSLVITEAFFDGGNVKYRINGGSWLPVPRSAFLYNGYTVNLLDASEDNTNPLGGEPGWTGLGGSWGTSVVDLTGLVSGGQTLQVRFDFGKDGCGGILGWYLDDFEVHTCPCTVAGDCDDGRFCNGDETCAGNVCQSVGNAPCQIGDHCDDASDLCRETIFFQPFQSGNPQGWTLSGAGSTASSGTWVFGDPVGTVETGQVSQPMSGFESTSCAFTAQNNPGSVGTDDVDNGVTYLVSPTIDLSGQSTAMLEYVRFFRNRDLGEDSGDFFIVQASSNNGTNWTTLENLDTNMSANYWTKKVFALESFISLTSTVRLRFGASDGPDTGNLIEGAVDDVRITVPPECSIGAECDDGAFCNGAEACPFGYCENGSDPCPGELCDEGGDLCVANPCDPPSLTAVGPRYLSIMPAASVDPVALQVTGDSGNPNVSCVDQFVQADGSLGDTAVFQTSAQWGMIFARGEGIIPESLYEVRAQCAANFSSPVSATTWRYGDINNSGVVDVSDISLILDGFAGMLQPPAILQNIDEWPCPSPDGFIDIDEIVGVLDAFADILYLDSCPAVCP